MSADHLLYPMDSSSHQNEWYDFDNFFEFPSEYLDSNPTSVDSISPKEYDLSYSDVNGTSWTPDLGMCSQTSFSDFVSQEPSFDEYMGHALDPGPVADFNGIPQLPSILPNDDFDGSVCTGGSWSPDVQDQGNPFYSTIKQMVESQAATDFRCSSNKEKRREASIALHLQRLQDAPLSDWDFSSDSNTTFPSPSCSDAARGSVSHGAASVSPATTFLPEPSSKSPTPTSVPDATTGGMEIVLDLNMNAPTNLPRKQKPRSRAQKDNYIKARKYGVCEKHRKQHKRCNCLDIAASRINANETIISTTATVSSTKKGVLQVHGPEQNRPVLQTTPRRTVSPLPAQSSKTVDLNLRDRYTCAPPGHLDSSTALSWLESNLGRHSSCSAQHTSSPTNMAQRSVQRQPHKETTPWRDVNQVPSIPGRTGTNSGLGLPATRALQQSVTVQPSSRTCASNPSSGGIQIVHGNGGAPIIHGNGIILVIRGSGASQRVAQIQTTSLGKESGCVQSVPGDRGGSSRVSSSQGQLVRSSLAGSAIRIIYRGALAFTQFWQTSTSATSWAGALLGRLLVFSSKQHWLARVRMGLL